MLNNGKKGRRAGAMAARHQSAVAMLRRAFMVLVPAWLVYFFSINLFVKQLNTITVPYVGMTLGTYLVIQGSALAFTIILYLLTKAYGAAIRP